MRKQIQILTILTLALFLSSTAFAQKGQGKRMKERGICAMIPDLSDKQKEQIEKIKTGHKKEVLNHRNQMGELRAKLRTLETADKADMGAIDGTIDQMGKLRTEMQKQRAAHKQEIRKLLTEDQRLAFDTRAGKRHKGKMRRKGRHGGHGRSHKQCTE